MISTASTQTNKITVREGQGGAVRQGANQLALVAPIEGGATISANVVKKVTRTSDAETWFGAGTKLALGVAAALGSGMKFVYAVAVAAKTGSAFTQTFGANPTVVTTGTLTSANMPLTAVTAATRDGTNILAGVKFTHDIDTAVPAAAEVYFNPKTGEFKLGTATTGAGAGFIVTYTAHDWSAAFDALNAYLYEVVTVAGYAYTAQNYGIIDKVVSEATTDNKIVATALASAVLPADVKLMVESLRNGRLVIAAAHYTGDMASAFGAMIAKSRVGATLKEQEAPSGVSYTGTYVRSDFGDEESPVDGTFHEMGVNAVFLDNGNTYRLSNDRASVGLTDFYVFKGTQRSVRYCEVVIDDELLALRRASEDAIPFTAGGLALVRGHILSALGFLRDEGVIDGNFVVVMPEIGDISASDKAARILPGVDVSVTLTGQVHMIKLDLNVSV